MEPQPLIGRDTELAAGRAALERVLGGRGALLLFSGEAGIGKTALADAVAAAAEQAGARVAWGRCWESGEAPAYWPWTQVFRALGAEDPFAEVVHSEGGGRGAESMTLLAGCRRCPISQDGSLAAASTGIRRASCRR
jgi:hypothetical protein